MMPSHTDRVQNLRDINHTLGAQIVGIREASSLGCPIRPDALASLLSELLRAGAGLRSGTLPSPGSDPAIEQELRQYRSKVEELREMLPIIHGQLLTERAQIEKERGRLESAAKWAEASRTTL